MSQADWVTIIDADFESPTYVLGNLNTQHGWVGASSGPAVEPVVVDGTLNPVIGGQAVKLQVGGDSGASSQMDISFGGDLIAMGYTKLRVSYAVHRTTNGDGTKDQNLWWWLWDSGEPTYGLQWDIGETTGGTYPHGWNTGAGGAPTIWGRYAVVDMLWDLETQKAYSWYDGVLIDNGIPISGVTTLTGWAISLGHDAATNNISDSAYIDNFVVKAYAPVPEPATLAVLGLGALGLIARRRRR